MFTALPRGLMPRPELFTPTGGIGNKFAKRVFRSEEANEHVLQLKTTYQFLARPQVDLVGIHRAQLRFELFFQLLDIELV